MKKKENKKTYTKNWFFETSSKVAKQEREREIKNSIFIHFLIIKKQPFFLNQR